MNYTDEQLIAQHIKIKTARADATKAYETQNAVYNKMLQAIEGVLNARLLQLQEDKRNISTEEGTVFLRTNTYVRVENEEEFLSYLRETGDLGMLDLEVTREAVEAYMGANNGHTPPGIKVTKIQQVITRK